MSATANLVGIDHTMKGFIAVGTITLAGNYGGGATHGDTLDLSTLGVPSNSIPLVRIWEGPVNGTLATFNRFIYSSGNGLSDGRLQIVGAAAEYTQGSAYAANFPNTIYFEALYPAFN